MIKSTKLSTKFTNKIKLDNLNLFIDEYRRVVSQFINILWSQNKIPKLLPKATTSQITTWLSARAVQAAAKQASGIVRGTRKKQQKRLYVYNKLLTENKTKQAKKLKSIIDKIQVSKPNINQVEPELDSRFIKQDWQNQTSFDGVLTLSSLGNKLKIPIPVKATKHFNKLATTGGQLKPGLRLSKKAITLVFDLPEVKPKQTGQPLGLDIGILNTFTLSNGVASQPCNHGHTLQTINQKLSRKTKASKAFLKVQQHRTNYINWSLNQINLDNTKTLRLENIKYLRYKTKYSRYLSHFTYTEIYRKLEDLCKSNGCSVEYTSPIYTSQRCSNCGWVRSSNRKGKHFQCEACKFKCDSDYNAACNIATPLMAVSQKQRLEHRNRKGFYWNVSRGKPIVSSTQESSGHK
jgi:transposase